MRSISNRIQKRLNGIIKLIAKPWDLTNIFSKSNPRYQDVAEFIGKLLKMIMPH